jgi:uncharacterized protein YbjQ (UPF0145 family)
MSRSPNQVAVLTTEGVASPIAAAWLVWATASSLDKAHDLLRGQAARGDADAVIGTRMVAASNVREPLMGGSTSTKIQYTLYGTAVRFLGSA